MKLNTVKLNVFILSVFVIHVWAMPGLTREILAAEAEAGAAQAGAEAGAATTAGVTTGTIAAGVAIAAAAALAIATSGGEGQAIAPPPRIEPPILPINPAVAQTVAAALQQLETNDLALLAIANTAWGTPGQTLMASAANALSIAEFQNVATLTANLDQATVAGLAAASVPTVLGSSQGSITPADAFNTSLKNTDFAAVIAALNTDIGTVPLAARDSLTPAQTRMYDYLAALRASAVNDPSLKAGFNGLYNAANQVKSDSTATSALTNLINGVGSFDTTKKLNRINTLLTQITSNTNTFIATQNLFKTTDSTEITAIQNMYNAAIVKGSVDSPTLTAIANFVTDTGTGTPAEIAQKQAYALMLLLTMQHPGYTVIVTAVHHGNNIFSTVAHIKK